MFHHAGGPALMLPVPFDSSGSPASQPTTHVALAVTAHGFRSRYELPDQPVADKEFDELLLLAGHHRLIGAVAEVVTNGALRTTDTQRATLTDHHADWMRQALRVEQLLIRVGECFSRAGVDARVLKGVALAHLVYPDSAWRVFSDLDLLVPGDQLDDATRLAREELGGTQSIPELRPGFDRAFGKEALVRVDGVELDIHRTFVTGPFGLLIDLQELFEQSTPLHVGGGSFQALDANMMFLHACYNAALGDYPPRLGSLRDLLVLSEQVHIDSDRVISTAREWGATAVVQRAARMTVDALALQPGPALTALAPLAALTVDRRELRLLRSYLTPARGYRRPLASIAVIPGLRAKARYARALVAPSREYLRSRGLTERTYAGRALKRLLPGRRG
jgi:hypothetical protein